MILDRQLKKALRFVGMKLLGLRPVTLRFNWNEAESGELQSVDGFVYWWANREDVNSEMARAYRQACDESREEGIELKLTGPIEWPDWLPN